VIAVAIGRVREDLVNVWDEDEPRPSLSLDEVFANAPERDGDHFRVPPVDA
jgi:Asp-tRNA(Asn)/Glu-tRNA(Gln) amidotransferase C subunit